MEGKLFKMVEGYTLSLTGSIDDLYAISDKQLAEDHKLHNLSLKNCDIIANGYDLDELINRAFDNMGYHSTVTPYEEKQFKLGYRIAFREALEILGDKKFSEKELTMLFAYGHQIGMNDVLAIQSQHSPQPMPKPDSDKLRDELIQSLQKNEWDVEIEMEGPLVYPANLPKEGEERPDYRPKLDENKCLILKRK